MLEKLQMYINGEWVDSHSTETIEVMNPSDDSVLGIITAGNSDDVDKAVAAAKAAFAADTELFDNIGNSLITIKTSLSSETRVCSVLKSLLQ